MAGVRRLVTTADIDEQEGGQDGGQVSVTAWHEAELTDGTRIPLLHDRGWGSTGSWADTSVEDVRATTLTVVGPDEPFGDRTAADMAEDHWAALCATLRARGVPADPAGLRALPHEVLLGPRLLERLGHTPPTGG